jgi:multidrug transporter EmrE-like cation transporter
MKNFIQLFRENPKQITMELLYSVLMVIGLIGTTILSILVFG